MLTVAATHHLGFSTPLCQNLRRPATRCRRPAGWARASTSSAAEDEEKLATDEFQVRTPPTAEQLRAHFIQSAVPMVGFGFMDNTVMIHAGNAIDLTLGVHLGLSTLSAAACGQICSDVAGISFGGVIDAAAMKLGLPSPGFNDEQRATAIVRRTGLAGSIVGVICGCSLGLTNLLFIDTEQAGDLKLAAQDDPEAAEFTIAISNQERVGVTTITVEGPATKFLVSSVTAAISGADCEIQGIHADTAALGVMKRRQLLVTQGGEQVDDSRLEAIARKVLAACRQPDRMQKLVVANEALQKENEDLRNKMVKVQAQLDKYVVKITKTSDEEANLPLMVSE